MSDYRASAIRILLIDDQPLFLAGAALFIDNEPGLAVIGKASNKAEALAGAQLRPDIILLDMVLGNECAVDFLLELMEAGEMSRALVLTGVSDPELHLRAVRLGARGVVLKTEPPAVLLKAIRKVHAGEVWLNRLTVGTVITELFQAIATNKADPELQRIASLTERELEVIALIAEGRRNKQIGDRLFISEKTVRHYLTSIFDKLEVPDRLALMIYAFQHGLAKTSLPSLVVERKSAS